MEYETGGCRDAAAVFLAIIIGLVAVACGVTVMKLDKSATERAQLAHRTALAEYQYELKLEQARLDNKVEMARVAEENHEQRIATLAVALAGLRDPVSGAAVTAVAMPQVLLGALLAVLAFIFLRPVLSRIAEYIEYKVTKQFDDIDRSWTG